MEKKAVIMSVYVLINSSSVVSQVQTMIDVAKVISTCDRLRSDMVKFDIINYTLEVVLACPITP